VELETFKNVAHGGRERLQIGPQIFADVILVAHELFQVERRGVVKELAGSCGAETVRVHLGFGALGQLGKHGNLGGFQHAIEAAQNVNGRMTLPYSDCL
jgi:hypothetical protein